MPITVSCDFPSGKTILGEAEEIQVNQCDTVLCFPHEVETDFPQSQITALMEASLTCSQEVTYSCLSAPWKVPTYLFLHTYFELSNKRAVVNKHVVGTLFLFV